MNKDFVIANLSRYRCLLRSLLKYFDFLAFIYFFIHHLLNQIFQKVLVSINWKFNEGWLKLSKSELNDIVKAISSHVQNQFIWEESVCHRIDFCKTLEQLDRIDIGTPLTTRVERIGVDNA